MAEFKDRIREVVYENCPDRGQDEFAERLGFSQATVNAWVLGKRFPNSFAVMLICQTYDISADWLLGLSDYKYLQKGRKNNESKENIRANTA